MKNFKEWMSDYLRYFMLILAAILVFALVMIGFRVYHYYQQPDADDAVVILTEQEEMTEKQTETESETQTEKVTESDTETESETEKETEKVTEKETMGETQIVDQPQTNTRTVDQPQTSAQTVEQAQTNAQTETESETQTETEPETEVYVPVYMTLTGACNFRSGPSYEDEVVTWYPAGTVVEFLEDVGGWYKVQIDGMIGYMGARFF